MFNHSMILLISNYPPTLIRLPMVNQPTEMSHFVLQINRGNRILQQQLGS